MKLKLLHQDVYISLVVYVAIIFLLSVSVKLTGDSAVFPTMLLVAIGMLNTVILVKGIIKTKSMKLENSTIINPIRMEIIKVPLIVFMFAVGYVIMFTLTNFFIATPIFMIGLMKYYKIKSWKMIILVTVIFNLLIYIGFDKMLNVPLL